jgi:hypothetical protein
LSWKSCGISDESINHISCGHNLSLAQNKTCRTMSKKIPGYRTFAFVNWACGIPLARNDQGGDDL